MSKKKGRKGRIHFKLVLVLGLCGIIAAGLIIGAIINTLMGGAAAIYNMIDQQEQQERQQQLMESVKLETAPEIVAMKPIMRNAIEEAIEEEGCLDLEEQEDAIIAWMMALCAASTDDWKVSTQRNIMGVPNFPKDGTPQESVEMAAKLIVSLYKEMTNQTGDGTFSVEEFKTKYRMDPDSYTWASRVKYTFDGGFRFGYSASYSSYASDVEKPLDEQAYSLQKMSLFTACYFLGNTDIAKWAALSLNNVVVTTGTSDMLSGDAYYNQEEYEELADRVYWNNNLLDSYEKLLETKVKEENSLTSGATTITDTSFIVDELIDNGNGLSVYSGKAPEGYFDDALFVGDSRIEGLAAYHGGLLDGATFYYKRGSSNSGLAIADVEVNRVTYNLSTYLGSHDFGKIYIMCGINSIGFGAERNAETFKEDLLDVILEKEPSAKIYILSNIKVTKAKGTDSPVFSKENMDAYNSELGKLANGRNILYLDVASYFDDNEGWLDTQYASSDGVHLLPSATPRFAEYIANNVYGQTKILSVNYDLIVQVYSYYNAYEKAILVTGRFVLPFDRCFENLVQKEAAVGDKFGFGRDAISDSNGNSSTGGATPHRGLDIPLYYEPLYACCDGYVSYAEFGSDTDGFPTTAGRYITITSSDGAYLFDYFHLSAIADGIHTGVEVKKGQLVGYSGNTSEGWSTWGAHFHFGIYDLSDYKYIDPLIILSNGMYSSTNIGGINDIALFEGRSDVKIIDSMPDWFTRPSYDSDTVRWLAAIIYGEAGNQPMEGKIAVGIVVMNRYEQWKDNYGYESVYDVITQGNGTQFNPATPGHSFWGALDDYDNGTLDNDCIEAAILAANGQKIISYNGETYDFTNILFFANVGYKDRPGVINIGDHGFADYLYWD